ncbi:MAG: outer membrane protein assembly factor BamD [Terracidiphilus sp.]
MNRLTKKIAVVALAVLVVGSVSVQAREKQPKKKKHVDLSVNPLAGVNSKQPDKELYDKAMIAMKKGRFDVARLDLQTMLNTYPESEYRMRAKLAVGDSWFKEGGAAAMTQAEAEYKDFITFFPTAPEAAEAQMKVADIYYNQMEKPDRDYNNTQRAEQEYRAMINQFPDSTLVPRAKQKLRDVQEVLAERETQIGLFYVSREQWAAAIARLETVVDTYPLYSKSDQALMGIGDAYLGESHGIDNIPHLPAKIKERMRAVYQDKAAAAFAKVITRYPMAPHVEDARDRLVAMNRTVPEPTQEALAENDAEERSRQPLHFTGKTLGFIKHGPSVVEAVHVGEPSLEDPKRTLAPDVNRENMAILTNAINAGRPAAPTPGTIQPTAPNEPPRSDQPNSAPLLTPSSEGGTGVGVSIVSAPSGAATTDANPVLKPVGPASTELPAAEKPAEPPTQVNDIKSGSVRATPVNPPGAKKVKKPKADLGDESSSKKKKKKGLDKLNPF